MFQYFDPDRRFQMLMADVSHQIKHTNDLDAQIAETCGTSSEFVRRQRKFLQLCPSGVRFTKENEMPKLRKYEISKDDLYREYIENEKTIAQCAEFFGCSQGVILNRMEEYGIPARQRGGDTQKKETTLVSTSEEITTPEKRSPKRLLERLILLSSVKEESIQELLEEALELLFKKYDRCK